MIPIQFDVLILQYRLPSAAFSVLQIECDSAERAFTFFKQLKINNLLLAYMEKSNTIKIDWDGMAVKYQNEF